MSRSYENGIKDKTSEATSEALKDQTTENLVLRRIDQTQQKKTILNTEIPGSADTQILIEFNQSQKATNSLDLKQLNEEQMLKLNSDYKQSDDEQTIKTKSITGKSSQMTIPQGQNFYVNTSQVNVLNIQSQKRSETLIYNERPSSNQLVNGYPLAADIGKRNVETAQYGSKRVKIQQKANDFVYGNQDILGKEYLQNEENNVFFGKQSNNNKNRVKSKFDTINLQVNQGISISNLMTPMSMNNGQHQRFNSLSTSMTGANVANFLKQRNNRNLKAFGNHTFLPDSVGSTAFSITSKKVTQKNFNQPKNSTVYPPQEFSILNDENTIFNHINKNLLQVKQNKNTETEFSKKLTQKIYDELDAKRQITKNFSVTSNETQHGDFLQDIQNLLSPQIKHKFLKLSEHKILTRLASELNRAVRTVINQLQQYKIDLSLQLEQILECFTAIFLRQYEVFFSTENEKEKLFLEKIGQLDSQKQAYLKQTEIMKSNEKTIANLIIGKNDFIEKLKHNLQMSEQQIDQMNAFMKAQSEQFQQRQLPSVDELIRAKEIVEQITNPLQDETFSLKKEVKVISGAGSIAAQNLEKKRQKVYPHSQGFSTSTYEEIINQFYSGSFGSGQSDDIELKIAVDKFYDHVSSERNFIIQDIQRALTNLAQGPRPEKECQTDLELIENFNLNQNFPSKSNSIIGEQNINPDQSQSVIEPSFSPKASISKIKMNVGTNFSDHLSQTFNQGTKGGKPMTSAMIKLKNIQEEYLNVPSPMSPQLNSISGIQQSSNISSPFPQEQPSYPITLQQSSIIRPLNSALMNYSKNKRQILQIDKEQVEELYQFLNTKFDQLIKKEVEKRREEGKTDIFVGSGNISWTVPTNIIVFLSNSIKGLSEVKKMSLISWPEFKKTIFEIYEHRILYSAEIMGVINNTYLSLDEHLIIFFGDGLFKSHGQQQALSNLKGKTGDARGTRPEIEQRLLEFIYSLKYYCTRWQRAKIFAEMIGFIYCQESQKVYAEFNSLFDQQKSVEQSEQKNSTTDQEKVQPTFVNEQTSNDFQLEDYEIPSTDIYLQEFFFYAFSFLNRDAKGFHESGEGFTYVKQINENRQSNKILGFLYGDVARDIEKWQKKIKSKVKKIKMNKLDDVETDWVDVDLMFSYYLEEYRYLRRKNMGKILSNIKEFNRRNQLENMLLSYKDLEKIMQKLAFSKPSMPSIQYAKNITFTRAFIYALTCGNNNNEVNPSAFLAACNRFGIDNPCPIITKRLALYGNQEDIEKDFKRIVADYNQKGNAVVFDPDQIGVAELNTQNNENQIEFYKKPLLDFMETQPQNPSKKVSAIFNFNMIQNKPITALTREKLIPPLATSGVDITTLDQQDLRMLTNKDYTIGGIKMNIKDIKNISQLDTARLIQQIEARNKSQQNLQETECTLVGGMSPQAHQIYKEMEHNMTKEEIGVSPKKIIIPSFNTTSKLFAQHFQILRELKHKIELLHQGAGDQMDQERSWVQIDAIIGVLNQACYFLDFPDNK